MADYELDPRPYFNILHSLLRHDDLDYDRDAIAKVVDWVVKHATVLRKVCAGAEYAVIMTYYAFWDKHKEPPSREGMKPLILARQQPEAQLAILEQYDKHEDDLTVLNPIELHAQLDHRIDDYNKHKLSQVLNQAGHITVGSLSIDDKARKTKIMYEGPAGALRYLHQREQEGILVNDAPAAGGLLAETAENIKARYEKTHAEAKNNNLFIRTGINLIDNHLGGLRRKEVNGVLGYVGQRKTGVVRTIGYWAALRGFRVLHIPLESDYDEEETSYSVIHAQRVLNGDHNITKKRVEQALLSPDEKELYFKDAIPKYEQKIAQNITVYTPGVTRSWADVRSIIERETDRDPVDLVIIDYITLLSTPGNRDDVADKIACIQDAKRLAMTANDGQGLCILTPVQGNRNGYEDAAENEGIWSVTGISKYSELDKSLDNCFYVYFNDGMNKENQMKMGSCKTRRDSNIPATLVSINPKSGLIENLKGSGESEATPTTQGGAKPGVLSAQLEEQMGRIKAESI